MGGIISTNTPVYNILNSENSDILSVFKFNPTKELSENQFSVKYISEDTVIKVNNLCEIEYISLPGEVGDNNNITIDTRQLYIDKNIFSGIVLNNLKNLDCINTPTLGDSSRHPQTGTYRLPREFLVSDLKCENDVLINSGIKTSTFNPQIYSNEDNIEVDVERVYNNDTFKITTDVYRYLKERTMSHSSNQINLNDLTSALVMGVLISDCPFGFYERTSSIAFVGLNAYTTLQDKGLETAYLYKKDSVYNIYIDELNEIDASHNVLGFDPVGTFLEICEIPGTDRITISKLDNEDRVLYICNEFREGNFKETLSEN